MNRRQQIEKFRKTALGRWLEGYYLKWRFQKEAAAYSGKQLSKSEHPSIIHFSVNKAATQHTKEVLQLMATQKGLVSLDYNDYAFHTNHPFLDHLSETEMSAYSRLFRPSGYLYSVFGGLVRGIPNFEKYRVILMVRDPRDILVSDYFSIKNSHPEPNENSDKHDSFMERRAQSQQKTIDQFVLDEVSGYRERLEAYLTIARKRNVAVLRYEDMVEDYTSWLFAISEHIDIPLNEKTFKQLESKNQHLFDASDQTDSHYRKGKAGDFREKLKPETIEKLNSELKTVLKALNYD